MDWKGGKVNVKMSGYVERSGIRRRVALGGLLTLSTILAFGADLPAAETILNRYVEVTGGKAAYERRTNEVVHGTVELAAMGIKGTMTEYFDASGKYYAAMDLAGVGKIETGLNDGVAWENSVLRGARIKTGEEKAQAVREATMNSTYRWRDLYAKAETAGEEVVEGEPCYKVVLTPAQGQPVTMYFEEKSGLMRKTSLVMSSELGEIPAEATSTEYRRFEDMLAPAKVKQKAAGQEITVTIQSLEANQDIPAERFALPDEVKAVLAKQKK